jgi:HEAT repeat protein
MMNFAGMNAHRFLLFPLIFATFGIPSRPGLAQEPVGSAEREALVKLQSAKGSVRRDAAEQLGRLRSRPAGAELAKVAASDPDPEVRCAAVLALGRIRDLDRIPDMIAVLQDAHPKVRASAVAGLVNVWIERDESVFTKVRGTLIKITPFWDERQTAVVQPYEVVDARVPPALARVMLDDPSHDVRVAAVRGLGALAARSEIDAMGDAMVANEKLRPDILDAFLLIGDARAARYTIAFFESDDASLARQAMITAGRLRYEPAVPALLAVYGADRKEGLVEKVKGAFSTERSTAALQSLAYTGDGRAEAAFYANVLDEDDDRQRAAFEGLAREGDPRFYEMVQRMAMNETNQSVRLAQYFAMYKMGHADHLQTIVQALRDGGQRDQAAEYLLEVNSGAELVPFMWTPHREAQLAIIAAIGARGDRSVIPQLTPLVKSGKTEVAVAADKAIRLIEWREAQVGPRTPEPESPAPDSESPPAEPGSTPETEATAAAGWSPR